MTVPPPPPSGPSGQDPYGSSPYGAVPSGGESSSAGQGAPIGHAPPPDHGSAMPGPAAEGAGGASSVPTGPAPGTDLGADLGAALRFTGQALLRNALVLLGAGALYSVLMVVVIVGAFVAGLMLVIALVESSPGYSTEPTGPEILAMVAVSVVVVLVAVPIGMLWQSGAARAGSVVLDGDRPRFGQAMIGPGRVLGTAVLVLLITIIGTILLYLPGLIAGVVLMYAIPAAARGASPVAALKESLALARANLGTTLVAYLVYMVATYLGSMIVVGMIAVIPFAVLFQMGLYERLSGRQLPDPAAT